jgi:hypothetical protein
MASKCRTVDPELFQKADFLRATYVARELFLGIICTCADDEGRFEVDAWGLAEKLFSRAHDADEQSVSAALSYWQERGWLLLYNDDKHGFLTGWFEHQYIRDPEPSSYPAPPVTVNSWRSVQEIKRWYIATRGGKDNSHFRTVLREYEQSLSTPCEPTANEVRTECVLSTEQVHIEGKGREGKGERAPAPAQDVAVQTRPTQDDAPDLSQVDTCNNPLYSAAWHYWQHNGTPPKGRENWCRMLVVQSDNAGIRQVLDDDAIIGALKTFPPLPAEWPDAWLGRLCRESPAPARQNPAAAADPVLAEFIRTHGPRPEDTFDNQDWSQQLAAYRQERETATAGATR